MTNEENPYEQLEYDLCQRCHRRKIDRSENPKSVLCQDCREELIKLKIPPVMIVAGVAVVAVVLLCVGMISLDLLMYQYNKGHDNPAAYINDSAREEVLEEEANVQEDSLEDEQGEWKQRRLDSFTDETDSVSQAYIELADEGMVVTALDGMLNELEADPDNLNLAITLTDVSMKYFYPDYAAYVLNTYLAGKNVSDAAYERLTGYLDELEIYYSTYDILDEIWNSLYEELAELEEDEEEYIQVIQTYHDMVESYLGIEEYDQALLYYDLAYLCQDEEERVQHLNDCVSLNENYFDAQALLGTYYRRRGDLQKARSILEESYQRNKESYEVLRSLATLELVEGNLEQGLEFAKQAYEIYTEGSYVVETYLVALMANGQTEEANALIEQWENEGYLFDDDFYSFRLGDMTLEEYYVGE